MVVRASRRAEVLTLPEIRKGRWRPAENTTLSAPPESGHPRRLKWVGLPPRASAPKAAVGSQAGKPTPPTSAMGGGL